LPLKLRRQEYRRLIEIITKAAVHGFGFVLTELGLERFLPRSYRRLELLVSSKRNLPQRFRELLEDLGPTFIKIGQILSLRTDILPLEYIEELEKLQDSIEPFSFEEALRIIETELQKKPEEVFENIDSVPLASASIAQVHKARLKSGEEVVIKVQRPEASSVIESDLRILLYLAEMLRPRIETIDTVALWEELATTLRNELDFLVEAGNIEVFAQMFENDALIRIPKVYHANTTRRLLTLEYIEGYTLNRIQKIREEYPWINLEELAVYGARAFMKQVLEFGVFHADLHPANIIITPEGQIAYLDFGMVGFISEEGRKVIARMLYAQIMKDVDEILAQAEALGAVIPRAKLPILKREFRLILERYYGKTLGEIKIDIIGKELVNLLHRHGIKIPKDYALLVKALITVEGVAHTLYPQINIFEIAKPYVEELVKKYYPASNFLKEIVSTAIEDFYILMRLPEKIENLIAVIEGSEQTRLNQIESIKSLNKTIKEASFLLAAAFMSSFVAIGLALVSLSLQSGRLATFLISVGFFVFLGFLLLLLFLRLFLKR
jgi:ubiquinone biosynthesis protein